MQSIFGSTGPKLTVLKIMDWESRAFELTSDLWLNGAVFRTVERDSGQRSAGHARDAKPLGTA